MRPVSAPTMRCMNALDNSDDGNYNTDPNRPTRDALSMRIRWFYRTISVVTLTMPARLQPHSPPPHRHHHPRGDPRPAEDEQQRR